MDMKEKCDNCKEKAKSLTQVENMGGWWVQVCPSCLVKMQSMCELCEEESTELIKAEDKNGNYVTICPNCFDPDVMYSDPWG